MNCLRIIPIIFISTALTQASFNRATIEEIPVICETGKKIALEMIRSPQNEIGMIRYKDSLLSYENQTPVLFGEQETCLCAKTMTPEIPGDNASYLVLLTNKGKETKKGKTEFSLFLFKKDEESKHFSIVPSLQGYPKDAQEEISNKMDQAKHDMSTFLLTSSSVPKNN
ncbi:hypothetical protein HYV11_03495 [Candidatus Dependentiae bacterium]|nr:hypothetical protein [Candidatus Dependentiae bacterium]